MTSTQVVCFAGIPWDTDFLPPSTDLRLTTINHTIPWNILWMLLKTSHSRILQISYILASTELASGLPFYTRSLTASKRLFATMSNGNTILSRVTPENIALEIKDPVDPTALEQVKAIIAEIRLPSGKIDAEKLVEVGIRLGDLTEGPFVVSPEDCKAAFEGLTDVERNALVNIYARVKTFAEAQRKAVVDMEIGIPGGKAGHNVSPCKGTLNHVLSH